MISKKPKEVKHTAVKSSMIHSIGYDKDNHHLEIQFKNGDVYEYKNVHPTTHAMFMASDSLGKFLASSIAPNHKYTKRKKLT